MFVIKSGMIQAVNEIQLAAYLSSGWEIYEPVAAKPEAPTVKEAEKPVKKARKTR